MVMRNSPAKILTGMAETENQSLTLNPLFSWANEATGLFESSIGLGTGKVWYVDSGATSGNASGFTWDDASLTTNAAIVLSKADGGAGRGDQVRVAQGHAETISGDKGWYADVSDITVIHEGFGASQGAYTFSAIDSTIAVGAANVTVLGGQFLAGISAVVVGIDVEDGADGVSLIGLQFPEPTTDAFEFVRAIINTTADNFTVAYCVYRNMNATGATNFLDLDGGVINGLHIIGNDIMGKFAEGAIHSDDADLEVILKDNIVHNDTTGQHAIEFTAAATGFAIDNKMSGDTFGSIFDPGSLRCSGNTQSAGINATAIDVPLVAGKRYTMNASLASVTATTAILFTVTGGPIRIVDFFGVVTTQIGASNLLIQAIDTATTTTFPYTTDVGADGDIVGTTYTFTGAVPSVLTPVAGAQNGGAALDWYCPIGTVDQKGDAAVDGVVVWSMTFEPLVEGVVVVPS